MMMYYCWWQTLPYNLRETWVPSHWYLVSPIWKKDIANYSIPNFIFMMHVRAVCVWIMIQKIDFHNISYLLYSFYSIQSEYQHICYRNAALHKKYFTFYLPLASSKTPLFSTRKSFYLLTINVVLSSRPWHNFDRNSCLFPSY